MNNSDKNILENESVYSPFFSIIIPAYNAQESITKAINSVNCQSFKDFEILIIDDCSTDKTFEVCKAIQKKISNIRIIRNNKNYGVSSSRNIALNQSKGKWILFLDSDDYYNDRNFLKFLFKHCVDADMVLFGYTMINQDNGNIIDTWSLNSENLLMHNIEIFECYVNQIVHWFSVWCRCYYKKFLSNNKLTFDESLNAGEDYLWFFQCLLCQPRLNCFDNSYYCYNKKKKPSLSKIGNKEKYSILSFNKCVNNVKKADIDKKYKQLLYKCLNKWLLTLLVDIKTYYNHNESKEYVKLLVDNKFVLKYNFDFKSKMCFYILRIFGLNFGSDIIHKVYNLLN